MLAKRIVRSALSLVLLLSGSAALSQETSERFRIRLGKGLATGDEEFRLAPAGTGYRLAGKVRLEQQGRTMEFSHDLYLAAGWEFESYRLESSMMGQTQTVEARREGAQIHMRASRGGQAMTKPAALQPNTIVLDNLVAGHYQVLLHRLAAGKEDTSDWSVLVPQQLSAVTGKVTRGPVESGRFDGKACDVRRYTLQLANALIDFWSETATDRLMRILVPAQDVEMLREGFEPAGTQPGPVPQGKFVEREVTFPSGDLRFPATLTLPVPAPGRAPVVVLVHGSGPHDRDETIGPNKPFRDIALGLAERGIATLRYEKRTYAFKQLLDPKTVTVDAEVTDDAVAALQYVESVPEVDSGRIFVLGHSLGGMMAPFIAMRFPSVRGVVLMAAAARPLDQLIYEQTKFGMTLGGAASADISAKVAELKAAFARIRSGSAPEDEMVFFAPARYWRSLFSYDIASALMKLDQPVLVLQGGKDVQVRRADYDLIDRALGSRPDPQKRMIWYPDLNHLYMKVEGEPTGAEYGRAGRVDSSVLDAIAQWIDSLKS